MKSILNNRYLVIMLGVAVLVALIYLVAGISALNFAEPLILNFDIPSLAAEVQNGAGASQMPIWKMFLFWLLLGILFVLVFSIFDKETRKRLLMGLLRAVVLIGLMNFILTTYQENIAKPEETTTVEGQPTSAVILSEQVAFTPPEFSSSFIYIITFIVLGTTFAFSYWWLVLRKKTQPQTELEDISTIAQNTLRNLNSGADWKNAIIECYVRMSESIQDGHGLRRAEGMTPSEFSARLVHAGLPASAVMRLTALFESVRYGAKSSNPDDIAIARQSLQEIISASTKRERYEHA